MPVGRRWSALKLMDNINSGYGMNFIQNTLASRVGGKVFFVSSVTTSAIIDRIRQMIKPDNQGVQRFFTTIDAAIGRCQASRGDVILVLPGHAETISNATTILADIAGVRIVGIGNGTIRPTLTFDTATTASIPVSAASIQFENFIFVANFAAIVSPFTLTTAKDFAILNCEFRDTSAILNFVNLVDTNTTTADADGLTITGCKRIGPGATNSTTIVKMDGTNDRVTITDNYFAHLATTGGGLMIIATGKVVTNAIIKRNDCNFLGATGLTTGILITTDGSTNSGLLAFNQVFGLDATTEILVTASSGFKFSQNFYSGTADTSGYLLPAADA